MTQIDVAELLQHQLDRQRLLTFEAVHFNDARNREQTTEIMVLTTRLKDEQVTMSELRYANESLLGLVEEMRASCSWRVTGPLRIMVALVRMLTRSLRTRPSQ
ncbi:hypothetical protein [Cryobacterium fucosi]|uniref:Uncharacterized protein n=1 Tax=Cryobacterium fucosi TaxID=1259157 RepID=A0A4R9BEX7_9MICO|nr:hypothetical protein [Cryobacterium fucosi]TFD82686.1 hypothetical protein E3T48_01675 [Cryobacterium fucosi]